MEPASFLAKALEEIRRGYRSVYLYDKKIGVEGAKELAAALKTNKTLTKLGLRDNSIGDEGAKELAAALKTNKTLTDLDLRNNSIGVEGANGLAAALKTNATLTDLDLLNNRIGDEGAKELAAALKTNTTLTTLSLGSNRIGVEGANGLAAGLKTNATLTDLNLSENRIGPDAAEELGAALNANMSLTSLDISKNKLGDEGGKKLASALNGNASALNGNPALTKLNLGGNKFDTASKNAIQQWVRDNKNRPRNPVAAGGAKPLTVGTPGPSSAAHGAPSIGGSGQQLHPHGAVAAGAGAAANGMDVEMSTAETVAVNSPDLIACVERGDKAGVEAAEKVGFSELSSAEQEGLAKCAQSPTGRLLALGLLAKYAPDAHVQLFVKCLSHEVMGVREAALQALAKVSVERLADYAESFVKITKRKPAKGRSKPVALAGYKALQLLSPEALDQVVVGLDRQQRARLLLLDDEVRTAWPDLQLEAECTLKKLPPSTLDKLRQDFPNLDSQLVHGTVNQGPPVGPGGPASIEDSALAASTAGTTFKVTLTQHDADAEETWTCECSSVDDGTVNDFTEHFATFPNEANLREQLIERFASVHSGRKLVCDATAWDGKAREFVFKAKIEDRTDASPVPPTVYREASTKQDDVIFPQQWLVALELAERIRRIYGKSWSDMYERFREVDFVIFTANLCTVADQTLKRVEARGVCKSTSDDGAARRVLRYSYADDIKKRFDRLQTRAEANPKTLYTVFADECHWGALKDKSHDHYINNVKLNKLENVFVILVSATPYCLLTLDSRLPERLQSKSTDADGQPSRTIVVETKAGGERKLYEQRPGGEQLLTDAATKGLTDVHVLSWKDVVSDGMKGGPHRCASEEDVRWLQDALQHERSATATWLEDGLNQGDEALKYQSLGTVYLDPSNNLIRGDDSFERLFEKSKEFDPKVDVSKLLAVEYVFCMLAQPGVSSREHLEWLVMKTPQYIQRSVHTFLQAHREPADVDGAASLVKRLAEDATLSKETKEIVSKDGGLLDPNTVRMQVLRVSDVKAGEDTFKFLRTARVQLGLQPSFELLGDFKDLNIQKEMDRTWFESFQDRPCEHRKGKARKPCDCQVYTPTTAIFTGKDKERKEKQCATCGHSHVNVCSYGDLNNRSLLLVLVAKGRLGDTFPSTFHCLDMRARNRSEQPSVMMSTLIQELGRLCRYCKDSDTRPYALVSKQLHEDIGEALAEGNQEDRLVSLLRLHGTRLDSHMMLMEAEKTRWEAKKAECTTMRELVALMRSCCKAREEGDDAVVDEDNASGGSKVIAYDAGRRGMDLSREERYHERRLLLLAEPQLGKTGAALGLIEVLRRKLAPAPIPFDDESDAASDDGGDPESGDAAAAYPEYATMQKKGLEHTSSTPANGKYGDPAVDDLWRSYVEDGKRGGEVDPELKLKGRGTTAKAKKPSADPAKPNPGPAQPKASPPASLSDQGRYETKKPERNGLAPIARQTVKIDFDDGQSGELSLSQKHLDRYWRIDEAGQPRLLDAEDCGRGVLFPIFCPSSGRPTTARIDLQDAMQNESYVQLTCVKHKEYESYLKSNPGLDFFVLPPSADELGIGAARMWIMKMARIVCPESFRFFFMLDDNVQAWKAVGMGEQDSTFAKMPYPFECSKKGVTGKKRDIPLCEVLKYFQEATFRNELRKFGVIGFDRLGRREVDVTNPFARRHVYKAVIVNLDVISAANYRENVHVWEDLDFNLRVSGLERQEGGSSSKLSKEKALEQPFGGAWLSEENVTKAGEPILDSTDPPGPAVIVKCYRFAYRQDQSIKKGGASGGVQRPDADETQDMVEETLAEPVDEGLKLLEEQLEALQQALQEEKAKDFLRLDLDRIQELQEQIKSKQAEVEAKKAAIENAAVDAEIELKRNQLSELTEEGMQAMDTGDMNRARECQKRCRETEQELAGLERQAKKARLPPADSGGAV